MKTDRFFVYLLIGIAVIIGISFVFVLSNQTQAAYVADDTPEGVVNNYLLAWVKSDYAIVDKYLVDDEYKPSIDKIINAIQNNKYSLDDIGVTVEDSIISNETASVTIQTFHSSSAYDSYYMGADQVILLIQQDGNWKISEAEYPFWDWDWYQIPESTNTK